ncbi:MAG: ribonuclease HII [archaeon]|nr:MAG: ribonuclease HII [archaeon]
MNLYIGIDDAGRGPLVGPMLLAGVLVNSDQKDRLKKLGIKDSKLILPSKRKKLFKDIKKISLGYEILATSPDEIDGRGSAGLNLNKIEAVKTAEIINELIKKIKEEVEIEVYVDCPSPNIRIWQRYVEKHLDHKKNVNLILKCEHKADMNHVECGAASILAKVTRDSEIEKIKKRIGIDFGSGYSSDERTIEFMKNHSSKFKHDGIFRKTWGTWKNHVKKKSQKKLFDY